MTRLFANKFSRPIVGLLILTWTSANIGCAESNKLLESNDLEKESSMPKTRDEIPEQDRWNVAALYANPDAWKMELLQIQKGDKAPHWPELKTFQGRLKDPAIAASFFDLYFGIDRKLSKLHTYAHLRMDEDLGNDNFKHDYGLISTLFHDFQLESSWIEPEILSLSDADYRRLTAHPSLKSYQFYLERVGRMRPHMLAPELEEMMALSGKALDTSYRAFGALTNADFVFKSAVDSTGEEHPLSNGSYHTYLKSPDRALRKSAFINMHQAYESHANTFCELIQGQIQSHLFGARARKFNSCLESALFPHAIDRSVYENLIAQRASRR